MSSRDSRGFTLIEAVVALAVVGLAGVAALEAAGGEVRAAERAREGYTVAALAQDRLAAVSLLGTEDLNPLPDSIARGSFSPPFDAYHWITTVRPLFGRRDLYDVLIAISSARSDYALATRLYRPVTGVGP